MCNISRRLDGSRGRVADIGDNLYIVYGRSIRHIDSLSTVADNWRSTACLQYSELSISVASRANSEMCGDVPGFIGGRVNCLWFGPRGENQVFFRTRTPVQAMTVS